MPPAAAAAMDVRSPMDSTQSQNPNSDFSFSFGAIPSADFSDNRIPSSNSSSFEGAAAAAAAAAASSNVARVGSRARPRLVKVRRQQPRSKSVAASDAGPGFNPFRSDSASNTVSSSGSSNGFGLLNGDAKCVNFESKGFVFGADGCGNGNLSGLDTNLGLGESVGNVGFVFSAKQSGIESNSSEEMRVNGEKAGKSDVGDAGKVEARSGLEGGKLSDVGFVFQPMASSTSVPAASLCSTRGLSLHTLTRRPLRTTSLTTRRSSLKARICAKLADKTELKYNKVGDSDLVISEITYGTMTFGEQNTEKEAHEILSYATERGINALDTAEAYPIPIRKETQGKTDLYIGSWLKSQPRDKVILATKVSGYSERSSYLRDNAKALRVDAANIKESVEKSLKRLGTDYIDLLQIHWYATLVFLMRLRME